MVGAESVGVCAGENEDEVKNGDGGKVRGRESEFET